MEAASAILIILFFVILPGSIFMSWRDHRNSLDSKVPPLALDTVEFVYVPCVGGCGNRLLTVAGKHPPKCVKCWDRKRREVAA